MAHKLKWEVYYRWLYYKPNLKHSKQMLKAYFYDLKKAWKSVKTMYTWIHTGICKFFNTMKSIDIVFPIYRNYKTKEQPKGSN